MLNHLGLFFESAKIKMEQGNDNIPIMNLPSVYISNHLEKDFHAK